MLIRSLHQIELPGGGGLLKEGDNHVQLLEWQMCFVRDLAKAGFVEIVEEDNSLPVASSPPAADASPPPMLAEVSPEVVVAEQTAEAEREYRAYAERVKSTPPPAFTDEIEASAPDSSPTSTNGTQPPSSKKARQRRVRRPPKVS